MADRGSLRSFITASANVSAATSLSYHDHDATQLHSTPPVDGPTSNFDLADTHFILIDISWLPDRPIQFGDKLGPAFIDN